jgi:VIT1/CCC1 family predicted Fe2+/Mn2+ transporter
MSNNNDNQDFFGDYKQPQDKLSVDIPAEQRATHIEKIPSAYDPMGEIYARGRAMRSMSSGGMPWWVLISGWVLFGGLFLLLLSVAIFSSPAVLPTLLFAAIPLLIVIRGTSAKLSHKKRGRK